MFFTSDNAAAVAPEVMAALARANEGYARSYGADEIMGRVRGLIRELFEAPEAEVYLVATGTAANALTVGLLCPPWGTVFCHAHAHIEEDECNAPEFYSHGAKLMPLAGAHGRIDPATLRAAVNTAGGSVHNAQRGMLSLTNVTERGTVYTVAQIAELAAIARGHGLPVHLDGARFANALAATGATPSEMTWRAGVDVLSFGGTKNGLMGVEAVVLFDPAHAWEFELRRKRGAHLFSKHRYLSAQFEAYLQDDLWLRLAARANAACARLAEGLSTIGGLRFIDPAQANIIFAEWDTGGHARLQRAGAVYYDMPAPPEREAARLVTSWSTTDADVDAFVDALRG
ncbi:MAG: beta-eliminating lyase-related protein [Paracoccaceae bacterium]